MVGMKWFGAIVGAIGTWFVGVSTLSAFWAGELAVLALIVLAASVVAALLVAFLIVRAHWRYDAMRGATASPPPASSRGGRDELDDVLAQSFPASDPPSSTTGIARVLPVPAG